MTPMASKPRLPVLDWVAPTSQNIRYSMALSRMPAKIQFLANPDLNRMAILQSEQSQIRNQILQNGLKPPLGGSFKWHLDWCASLWTAPSTLLGFLLSVTSLCMTQDSMCQSKVRHCRWRAEYLSPWYDVTHHTLRWATPPLWRWWVNNVAGQC